MRVLPRVDAWRVVVYGCLWTGRLAWVPTRVSPEFRTLQRRHPKTGAAVATLLARHFAQCLTETRRLLRDREGPIPAARCLAEASREAAEHADPPPGW